MKLKYYYDLLSQPSRAIYILLRASNVSYEDCPVPLRKGAQLTDDYKNNVSKFQKVPVLHDGDFKLTESVAILRYLAAQNVLADSWYPKDSKEQAKVDEYLEWQHHNTRGFCSMYFAMAWLMPQRTGKHLSPEKLEGYKQRMSDCLDSIETLWLSPGPYIVGNKLTAADIWAACEIEQPRMTGYDPTVGRPILAAWLERVRKEADPSYGEAHDILNKVVKKNEAKL